MILVIGEEILDIFIYCEVKRMSPESCALVAQPVSKTMNSGGAGNVVANLKSLGNQDVIAIHQKQSITKTRFVHKEYNQHLLRVDENDSCENLTLKELNEGLSKQGLTLESFEIIVISDYCKGFITEPLIKQIRSCFCGKIFIDTKKLAGDWCNDVDFIKINSKEYRENFNNEFNWDSQLFVTRGGDGVEWVNQNVIIPTEDCNLIDVSGSGDSHISGLVTEYIKSKDIKKSLTYANKVATIAASCQGVVAVEDKLND